MKESNLNHKFAALADPARRELILHLAKGPQTAGILAEPFKISRPAVSRHLRVLREAGLVTVQTIGRERLYQLSPSQLHDMQQWLAELELLWDDALSSLKEFAEANE